MPTALQLFAAQKANERGLDPGFVNNLISAESNYNPLAVSRAGARGLMQLMPMTAHGYGVTNPQDLFDPAVNIDVGTRHIAHLAQRYSGDPDQWAKVAAAYNAGEGRVPRDQPLASFFSRLPAETRAYVPKVAGPVGGQVLSAISTHAPSATAPPVRQASLQTAQDPGLFESIYNYVFGQENAGLPPVKTWPGPELGLPPDQLSTGDLASMGLLALSGMGAAAPTVGRALPALLPPMTIRSLGNMALGYMGSQVGGQVGEAVGGDVGRNIGQGVGGLVSLPYRKPPVIQSDLVDIPPIGPLEGTAVLTRRGTAKPMVHGTPSGYPGEMQLDYNKHPERLLFGPGHYFTSAAENVAEGYAGKGGLRELKLFRQLDGKATQAEKKAWKGRTELRAFLTPEERAQYDAIDWGNSRWRQQFEDITGPAVKRHTVEETEGSMTLQPAFERAFINAQQDTARAKQLRVKALQQQDKIDQQPTGYAPNIRPAYLNIKKPFDIDRKVLAPDLRRMADALETYPSKDPQWPESVSRLVDDLRFDAQVQDRLSTNDGNNIPGERLYNELSNLFGSKKEVNAFLQQSGFDGITHIGGGRFTGGPHKPIKHRVYIAFRDDQVVPYFQPEFSEAQAKREWLKKQLRAQKGQQQ